MPVADFFNAPPSSVALNTTIVSNVTHLVYKALRAIEQGQQIYMRYGSFSSLSDAQLLMDYGFVLKENMNNVVMIDYHILPDTPNYERKLQLFEEARIGTTHFSINKDEFPVDLVTTMRITKMTEAELHNEQLTHNAISKRIVTPQNEIETFRSLIILTSNLLHQYPTLLEQDETFLKIGNLSPRQEHAIIVRLGEKKILTRLLGRLQHYKRGLEAQTDKHEL